MKILVLCVAVLFCLSGCGDGRVPHAPNSTFKGYLDASRPAGVPNCYIVEYKGQEYIINSQGGIVAVPAQ